MHSRDVDNDDAPVKRGRGRPPKPKVVKRCVFFFVVSLCKLMSCSPEVVPSSDDEDEPVVVKAKSRKAAKAAVIQNEDTDEDADDNEV